MVCTFACKLFAWFLSKPSSTNKALRFSSSERSSFKTEPLNRTKSWRFFLCTPSMVAGSHRRSRTPDFPADRPPPENSSRQNLRHSLHWHRKGKYKYMENITTNASNKTPEQRSDVKLLPPERNLRGKTKNLTTDRMRGKK
uniref:Uncharacterized protein n=1 Tax=Trichuris muris TaxID=70415 RepID=A0A5S6R0G1_TRIMR